MPGPGCTRPSPAGTDKIVIQVCVHHREDPESGSLSHLLRFMKGEPVFPDTGVSLDWREGKHENPEHFTFPELETMRITVQNLIGDPVLFGTDLKEHKICRRLVRRG